MSEKLRWIVLFENPRRKIDFQLVGESYVKIMFASRGASCAILILITDVYFSLGSHIAYISYKSDKENLAILSSTRVISFERLCLQTVAGAWRTVYAAIHTSYLYIYVGMRDVREIFSYEFLVRSFLRVVCWAWRCNVGLREIAWTASTVWQGDIEKEGWVTRVA